MSNERDELTIRLQSTRDGLRKQRERLSETLSAFHPERVVEARQKATEALDKVDDALDAAAQAEATRTNALSTYQTAMRAHLEGRVKAEPKAPSPSALEAARVKAVGRAGALLVIATGVVNEYVKLEESEDVQAELRENIRAAFRATKEAAREALERAMDLVQRHQQTVSEAHRAFSRAGLLDGFGIAWRQDRYRQERESQLDRMRGQLRTEGTAVASNEWVAMGDAALLDAHPDLFLGGQ